MIRAGSHGQLLIDGFVALRCTDWNLSFGREFANRTPVYRWAERSRGLRTTITGQATLFYDVDDAGADAAISSFRANRPPPLGLELRTDRIANQGYDCNVHILSVGTRVAVRDGHKLSIGFAVTGPITQV
jgi:hypothetical protein